MTKFIILVFLCLAVLTQADELQDTLLKIQNEKADIQRLFNDFSAKMNTFKAEVSRSVLDDIKKNGLYLGNRWRIAEEGTGSYEALVFRDMTTSRTVDRRYAFFQNRYIDL